MKKVIFVVVFVVYIILNFSSESDAFYIYYKGWLICTRGQAGEFHRGQILFAVNFYYWEHDNGFEIIRIGIIGPGIGAEGSYNDTGIFTRKATANVYDENDNLIYTFDVDSRIMVRNISEVTIKHYNEDGIEDGIAYARFVGFAKEGGWFPD